MATISDFLLRVRVEGQQLVDKLVTSTDKVDKNMNKVANSSGKMKAAINDVGTAFAGAASTGNQFADSLVGAVGNLGRVAAGVGLVAGAFGALGLKAINLADEIADISDATGISASSLLNLKQSLIAAGGNAEDFVKIASKLNQNIGEAANGSDQMREKFQKLGVALGDSNGNLRSTDDILQDVLSALANVEDPAKRAAMAVDLVGKAGNRIDWTKVNAINDPFKEEQIQQLAKYRNAIDSIAASIENKLLEVFGRLAIEMQTAADKAEKIQSDLEKRGKTGYLDPGVRGTISGLLGITPKEPVFTRDMSAQEKAAKANRDETARQAARARAAALAQQRAIQGGGGGGLSSESDKQKAANEAARETLRTLNAQTGALRSTNEQAIKYQNSLNGTIGMQKLQGDIERSNLAIENDRFAKVQQLQLQIEKENAVKDRSKSLTNQITGELRQQITLTNEQAAAMKKAKQDEIALLEKQRNIQADIALLNEQMMQALQLTQLASQNELIGLYGDELRMKQGLLTIEQERARVAEESAAKLRALGKDATDEDRRRTQEQIDNAQNAANRKVEIFKDQVEREKALRNDTTTAIGKRLEELARAVDPAVLAVQKVDSVFANMDQALTDFVNTGKFKFKDFALSVVKDLIMIELKAQATKILSSIVGSIFGIPGRAAGGPVGANQPYIVGENGPELFMPKTSGSIVSNSKLQGMNGNGGASVGGNNTYITNNISAVDAKSVAQLFVENRKTLLGTVNMARKEMPYAA